LTFDVIDAVDWIRIRKTDRIAFWMKFVEIHSAAPEALTQKAFFGRKIGKEIDLWD